MPTSNSFLNNGKTFKSVIDMALLASDKGKLPKKIKILPCGEWMTMPYGPMSITDEICNQMVANFNASVRKAVPIDVNHDGEAAAGWINGLTAKAGDGVYADVEWTKLGKDLLSEKIYRLFSPEWSFDYVDPEHSTHHGAVLVAGSLTNRPLFKELPLLVASDGSGKKVEDFTKSDTIVLLLNSEEKKNMPQIVDILKKVASDRTAEELEFLKANDAELTEEQKKQLADEEAAKVEAEKVEKEKAEKEAADKAEADKKLEEEKKAAEGKTVTIKASEYEGLQKQIADFKAAEHKAAVDKEVDSLIASEKGGKFVPAGREALTAFLMTCSEDQRTAFLAFANSQPDLKITGQSSKSTNENLTAKEQLEAIAKEKVEKSEGKMTASEGLQKAIKENPVLAKQYQEELKSSK